MSPRRTQRPQVPAERRARRIAVAVGVAVVVGTAAETNGTLYLLNGSVRAVAYSDENPLCTGDEGEW